MLKREWEGDLKSEGRDPNESEWLAGLLRRHWRLSILDTAEVRPDSECATPERLKQRRAELRRAIEEYGSVIWPIVVRAEGNTIADGYCRYTTLEEMGVPRLYAYLGSPESPWGPPTRREEITKS